MSRRASNDRRPQPQPRTGDRAPSKLRRTASAVAICLALVHATQVVTGGHAMAAVVAFGLCAAWMVGWRSDVLRSVRTAVVLLVALSVACIVATLTVQRSQLEQASDEQYQGTVAFAWAHLAVKMSHPWPRAIELAPEQEQRLERLARVFGEAMADEQREKLVSALAAGADEERARGLARAHPALFASAYRAASGLMLTDLFRAWWFLALFYLLCLNLLLGAVRRRKLGLRNVGFHSSHLGLVLVVAGATVGGFLGERGFVALEVGEPASQFRADGGEGAAPLGFSIRLDRFETLYHEDLVIEAGGSASADPHHGMMGRKGVDSLTHTEKLEVGKVLELRPPEGDATYRVTMAEITRASGLERTRRAAGEDEDGAPAARIRLGDGDAFWLGGKDSQYIDAANRFKIRASSTEGGGGDGEDDRDPCADLEGLGSFTVRLGDDEPIAIPAATGRALSAGGLRATVMEVYPDFSVGGAPPSPDDFPRNPAVRVSMEYGGDGPHPYLFFASEEFRSFTQLPWSQVTATFDFDFWCSPTGGRIDLQVAGDGTATARLTEPGEPAREIPVTPATTIPLPGTEDTLAVLEVLPQAVEDVRPVLEDSDDGSGSTALRLMIDDGGESEERWLLSNTVAGSLALPGDTDDGIRLRLEDNRGRPPRDWKSSVSVLEEGQVVAGGVVQVNDPFCYGGYCFFQSDANPDRPTYSGLQVVRDPSWSLVKAGLWMLLLGIAWVFYVQPLFDRRRGGPDRATAATGGDA